MSSRNVLCWPGVRAQHARRDERERRRRRERVAVGLRRDAVGTREAGRERADAAQTDGEADVGDRAVGGAQQRRGALEPAGQEVLVRRLAERTAELAAEVRAREAGAAREVVDVQRLEVPGVGQVLGAEQVAYRGNEGHRSQYGLDRRGGRDSSAGAFRQTRRLPTEAVCRAVPCSPPLRRPSQRCSRAPVERPGRRTWSSSTTARAARTCRSAPTATPARS